MESVLEFSERQANVENKEIERHPRGDIRVSSEE